MPAAGLMAVRGLSPRVRGKPGCCRRRQPALRSIPACAGEAREPARRYRPPAVYPRVCGGSSSGSQRPSVQAGLSPRVRGKLIVAYRRYGKLGSIPACAGEAPGTAGAYRKRRVYPRVCGGSLRRRRCRCLLRGLSPRVRGKHAVGHRLISSCGSIPACAGEAYPHQPRPALPRVYPRVCGGSKAVANGKSTLFGLSPRVRGKHKEPMTGQAFLWSIPACAGEAG